MEAAHAGGDVVMVMVMEVGDDRWASLLAGKIMEVVLLSIFFKFQNLISKSVKYLFQFQISISKFIKYLPGPQSVRRPATAPHPSIEWF